MDRILCVHAQLWARAAITLALDPAVACASPMKINAAVFLSGGET
jgi:hypothetical protein